MGLLDFFKTKSSKKGKYYAPTMNGDYPFYTPFGENIYASDIIVQAIRCKANEFKKLEPRHITMVDGAKVTVTDSDIARVLRRPNEYMTPADFLEKITILLELNKNVFIYPKYAKSKAGTDILIGLYPLKPANVEYLTDKKGDMFIHLRFLNGYEATLPADSIIHWRKDYGVNDYFGGGMFGGNDNKGLLKMLKRYDELTQSISKALQVSCTVNGIMKINSYMEDEQKIEERKKFEQQIEENKSGVLFTDMSTEYVHIPRDIKLVDKDTIKFFHDCVLMNTGVSEAILRGDYTKAQKEAFYESALESDIKSLGQAMSRVIFTARRMSYGNEIVCYPNRINFMSMENKIAALSASLPAGIFMKDEAREILGYPPLPDGQGQVIAQGYNALLDEDNNNKLSNKK